MGLTLLTLAHAALPIIFTVAIVLYLVGHHSRLSGAWLWLIIGAIVFEVGLRSTDVYKLLLGHPFVLAKPAVS